LSDSTFINKHRLKPTAFSRKRSLDFSTLFLFLLNFRKQSGQVELNQFFQQVVSSIKPVSQSALTQARNLLSPLAFKEINQNVITQFYSKSKDLKQWKGFRVCAVDGSSIRLPATEDVIKNFGVHKGINEPKGCPMALSSVLYDVLNKITIDSTLETAHASERECAEKHFQYTNQNDLTLYDRGYNAFWLYALHQQHNKKFCMRVKASQMNIAKVFIKSNQKQQIITLKANKSSIKTCVKKDINYSDIELRLIRVDLENEVEVLITNLNDEQNFPAECFKSLYHLRWGIEENYKRLKQWLEIENFSGKSALSVQQDFYAKILASNLTQILCSEAQKGLNKKTKNNKLSYQVNFAQSLSKVKNRLVELIYQAHSAFKINAQKIADLIESMSLSPSAVRKNRSFSRQVKKKKNNFFYQPYKSSL